MAVGMGFEPMGPLVRRPNSLANCRNRPLCQPTINLWGAALTLRIVFALIAGPKRRFADPFYFL